MDKSQIARIVEFDLKVRGGWFPSRSSFATECGFCERTVARDIEYIRERLGAPLAFNKERMGYYYSKPWNFPSILMATFKSEEKIDYAIKLLMEMNEKDRDAVIKAVIDQRETAAPTPEATETTESAEYCDDFMVEYDFRGHRTMTQPKGLAI